jgi:hypothetical protein
VVDDTQRASLPDLPDPVTTHVFVEAVHRLRGTSCDVDASTCRFPVVYLSLEPNACVVIGVESNDHE